MFRFLAAMIVAGPALAGGIVQGIVVDQSFGGGASLPHTVVRLLPEGSSTTRYRAEAGRDGEFRIENVTLGTYTLRAYRPGFREEAMTVTVVEGEIADAGRVVLRLAGCDSPGTICDNFGIGPPSPPDVARGDVVLRLGCGVDLDKAAATCPDSASRSDNRVDLRFEAGKEGAIYLTPINGAIVTSCEGKSRSDQPIRIDGLGPGNDWCVQTNAKHYSHVFIEVRVVEPGADEVILWVVTRQ
jgi:hypothetical protein